VIRKEEKRHGDSTEIALVKYALTKNSKKGTGKEFPREDFHSIRQENA
jgi:hypothetical protein